MFLKDIFLAFWTVLLLTPLLTHGSNRSIFSLQLDVNDARLQLHIFLAHQCRIMKNNQCSINNFACQKLMASRIVTISRKTSLIEMHHVSNYSTYFEKSME